MTGSALDTMLEQNGMAHHLLRRHSLQCASGSGNLGCFLESYNYLGHLGNQFATDFGMNWQVSRRVQLDIAANMDLSNPSQCWAVSCGVAWQMNR